MLYKIRMVNGSCFRVLWSLLRLTNMARTVRFINLLMVHVCLKMLARLLSKGISWQSGIPIRSLLLLKNQELCATLILWMVSQYLKERMILQEYPRVLLSTGRCSRAALTLSRVLRCATRMVMLSQCLMVKMRAITSPQKLFSQ